MRAFWTLWVPILWFMRALETGRNFDGFWDPHLKARKIGTWELYADLMLGGGPVNSYQYQFGDLQTVEKQILDW